MKKKKIIRFSIIIGIFLIIFGLVFLINNFNNKNIDLDYQQPKPEVIPYEMEPVKEYSYFFSVVNILNNYLDYVHDKNNEALFQILHPEYINFYVVNNNNLSIVLTYGVGATDIVYPEYYTYNIDLKTGNQLSYEELYNIAGLNSSNINSKVEKAITKIIQDKLTDDEKTNFNTYNDESINNYKNSVSNNTLKYFLSNDGKLNIIVKLSIPVGPGEFDTIITVE